MEIEDGVSQVETAPDPRPGGGRSRTVHDNGDDEQELHTGADTSVAADGEKSP